MWSERPTKKAKNVPPEGGYVIGASDQKRTAKSFLESQL